MSTEEKDTDGSNYIDVNGGEGYRRLWLLNFQRSRIRTHIAPTTDISTKEKDADNYDHKDFNRGEG